MPEDVNFIDLIALTRIGPDTVVEKFGGAINSSFFDASNILASLKQKGLVDFTTSFPGQSAITVTELGKQLIADSNDKAKADFDALDYAAITQLSGGKRSIADLTGALNIRPKDLAMHLYRLSVQQYVAYEFRNGIIDLSLTEKGFLKVKEGMQPSAQPQAAAATQMQQAAPSAAQTMPNGTATPTAQPETTIDMKELESKIANAKKRKIVMFAAIVAVVVIIIIVLALTVLHTLI